MSENQKHYLIISPSWVGDMVMAQTLFKMIKHHEPHSTIDVIAPKWSLTVASRMSEVNNCIESNFSHGEIGLAKRYKLGKSLRQRDILETNVVNNFKKSSFCIYDEAIILPNSFKAALVPYFANIKKRTGYIGEFRYHLINNIKELNKRALLRTIDRFCYLFDESVIDAKVNQQFYPNLNIDKENQHKLISKFNINKKLLILCPGAEYGSSKQWDFANFAKIAKAADAAGYQVIALGSQKDYDDIAKIKKEAPEMENLAGKTSLLDAIDLLALANKVLTNDSGLMHIAASVGAEVFAIYGSTTPTMTPPLSEKLKIIEIELGCRPCFKRECPIENPAENHICMKNITAEHVWSLLSIN